MVFVGEIKVVVGTVDAVVDSEVIAGKIALMFAEDVILVGKFFLVVEAVVDITIESVMLIIGVTAVNIGNILVVIAEVVVVVEAVVKAADFLKL